MNASGLLWSDAGLLSLYVYVFYGGWIATASGWAISLYLGLSRGLWRVAGGLALLGLLPMAYLLALIFLDSNGPSLPTSDAGLLMVFAGMAMAILTCPAFAIWKTLRPSANRKKQKAYDR